VPLVAVLVIVGAGPLVVVHVQVESAPQSQDRSLRTHGMVSAAGLHATPV
jgi:hypothetical protein